MALTMNGNTFYPQFAHISQNAASGSTGVAYFPVFGAKAKCGYE
jgi:hypothetical protein